MGSSGSEFIFFWSTANWALKRGVEMSVNVFGKRALLGAVGAVAVSLVLIAYAARGMGINIPTCMPLGSKLFAEASVIKHDNKVYEVHYFARM
jgi:hypothetical protein